VTPEELLEWVNYLNNQCPECEGEEMTGRVSMEQPIEFVIRSGRPDTIDT
jgi:hypothetical protein